MSKPWCAFLIAETARPRSRNIGISLSISVVLPLFEKPMMPIAFIGSAAVRDDALLDRGDISGDVLATLRQRLDPGKRGRAIRFPTQCFDDRFRELRGQRRFETDHWDCRIAVFERDLHAIRGVRIDQDAVSLFDRADRAQAIKMRAAPRNQAAVAHRFEEWRSAQMKLRARV